MFLEGYNRGVGTKKEPAIGSDFVSGAELPFNFEVVYDSTNKIHLEFINGSEKIKSGSYKIGRDKATAHDTIEAYFPEYDTYLHGVFNVGIMDGDWWCLRKIIIEFHSRQNIVKITDLRI